MKRIIWLLLLLFSSSWYSAQSTKDTLQSWISGFSRLVNPISSDDGRWVAVRKRYDLTQDTLLVVDTQKPDVPIGTIALGGEATFIKGDGLLVFGQGKAKFQNLKTGEKKNYNQVKIAYPLTVTGKYAILDKETNLSVYNTDNERLQYITGVQEFPVTDNKKKLYVFKQNADHYEILDLLGNESKVLRTTLNTIKKVELSLSGKYIIVQEIEKESNKSLIVLINTLSGKTDSLPTVSTEKNDYYRFTEIQEGKALFISLHSPEKPQNKLVDIWYGNDENLKTKKTGVTKNRYWLWQSNNNKIQELPTDTYPVISAINSDRYFLAFHPTKGHDYLNYEPQLKDVQIYDVQSNSYRRLDDLKGITYGSSEIFCSYNGKYLLGSEDGKRWSLFELEPMTKSVISQPNLQNPVFTMDGRYIFFESSNDLWRYEIKTKKLTALKIATGKQTKIINRKILKISEKWNFSLQTIDLNRPLLIQALDQPSTTTSYLTWKRGKQKETVSSTENYVRNFTYDDELTHFYVLEENFNKPPTLSFIGDGEQKRILIPAASETDKSSKTLKQDIIHYTTKDGLALKGLLYYPVNFNPAKKYPMIVHIYQIQNRMSNQYITPGYHNRDELDIRTLLEKGYFVLLPDTVVGDLGPGLSALDCVHKALDAVSTNPGIDMHKVGLIGHSFGGYETNFIATHSDRFAAYISGAGLSDIIRSYFSYNYHFPGPYFWQYETGQYRMNISFLENKELYFSNNPIFNMEKVNAPILLWTGQQDENVPWDQTMEFFMGLRRHNKKVVALFYPNGRHALGAGSEEKKDLHQKVLEWWDYFLKDKKNVPWINNQ
ncbi:alpha/beta hydrolase family protein [Chryseobacterium herbae]|uniref:Prolyl oligopeptidase family serine peptidase n=1 Tax=Chryseobacterium herbae TaxID=2976476 RepID=A0ABT2ISM6_9FLAO|nr:prolyl oligopeptidase family serine peptidase [Chryseobacterium sp. pc1-10]MCT2561823.1 prolyl oligopeptidase family serine peptidase [Chryseobacterium sp. pc1-10]